MKSSTPKANSLVDETSPYLLQHAFNPVGWYPWGDKAIELAQKEHKPIFLSIGYSACHWCHVMAHESFENEEIADILNREFVSIKVDREVRPDLDDIYMKAVQLMTGGGGWPMSVFLTPRLQPFYGGTYFPPTDRYGRVGFKTVLTKLAELWHHDQKSITENATNLTASIIKISESKESSSGIITANIFKRAEEELSDSFDSEYGGFGPAPKFPQSMAITLLLRRVFYTRDKNLLHMALCTLDKMAQGGMYDHLGGGFHRYSTDRKWLVPHFEKMLYDNALLGDAYLEAYKFTGDELYKNVVVETLDYALEEMVDKGGGFHSAQDADSEGKEGIFYTWKYDEIKQVSGEKDALLFCEYYSIRENGNFSSHESYHADQNILHRKVKIESLSEKYGISVTAIRQKIEAMKHTLKEVRNSRIPPGKDDKVIVSWNGLMITTLAHAYQSFGDEHYLNAAVNAATFISENMREGARLLRVYRNGVSQQLAYLDDYAYFIVSLIDLYETTFDTKWLILAEELTNGMIDDFWDSEKGSFFFSAQYHNNLFIRMKPDYEGAIPSGNSIAALALFRLSKLRNNQSWFEKAAMILTNHIGGMERVPGGYFAMLNAVDFYLNPPEEIAIVGKRGSAGVDQMVHVVYSSYLPNKIVVFKDESNDANSGLETLLPLLEGKKSKDNKATAFICKDFTCRAAVNTVEGLGEELKRVTINNEVTLKS